MVFDPRLESYTTFIHTFGKISKTAYSQQKAQNAMDTMLFGQQPDKLRQKLIFDGKENMNHRDMGDLIRRKTELHTDNE